MPELPDHPRVVVEPLLVHEERIHVRVGIQIDADEQVRVRAGERRDDPRRGDQVAALVGAHLRRVQVVGERAREPRRLGGARQILEVVAREDDVVLVPLAVGVVLLEVIDDVPLRSIAGRIRPDSAVEHEVDRELLLDCIPHDSVERIVRHRPIPALALQIEVRIEHPVRVRAFGRAQVEDRHGDANLQCARQIGRVRGVHLGGAVHRDARRRHEESKRARCRVRRRAGQIGPQRECLRRDQALARERGLLAGAIDCDDRDLVAQRSKRRKIRIEFEASRAAVRITGLHATDVLAGDAVMRRIRAAVDAHLDRPDSIRVERPAGNVNFGTDDRFGDRNIDPADGAGWQRRLRIAAAELRRGEHRAGDDGGRRDAEPCRGLPKPRAPHPGHRSSSPFLPVGCA